MPTYEYECQGCGKKFELFQSIKALPITECPACKATAKRLIGSGVGIIFKGSGFYATDYKNRSDGHQKDEKDTSPPSCHVNEVCKKCDGKDKTI